MWFEIQNKQVKLRILAKPNARKSALAGANEQELLVALHAKPHEGEANTELISFLAKLLKTPKTLIRLERGESSRHKQLTLPLNSTIQQLIDDPAGFIVQAKIS